MHKLTSILDLLHKTIRHTLLAKLESSQTFAELQADFEAIAGFRLRLVGPSRITVELASPCINHDLCDRIKKVPRGLTHCQQFVSELVLQTKSEDLSCNRCDAGLTSFCVPLRHNGETIGYFLAGGYRTGAFDATNRNRMRHLLTRMKIPDLSAAMMEFEKIDPEISKAKHNALQRWLKLAAEKLVRSLDVREEMADRPMPTFIIKICSHIERKYQNPPTLREAAELCNLSEGYFCRAFHKFTGLRFVEYIHAVRIEHVCDLLQHREMSITDAAFEVGFHSLSQFNRVFLKSKGMSPRRWRSEQVSRMKISTA